MAIGLAGSVLDRVRFVARGTEWFDFWWFVGVALHGSCAAVWLAFSGPVGS